MPTPPQKCLNAQHLGTKLDWRWILARYKAEKNKYVYIYTYIETFETIK